MNLGFAEKNVRELHAAVCLLGLATSGKKETPLILCSFYSLVDNFT